MQEEKKAVLRLIPDPLSYWICTTNGNDKALIEEVANKNPEASRLEVLEMVAGNGSN